MVRLRLLLLVRDLNEKAILRLPCFRKLIESFRKSTRNRTFQSSGSQHYFFVAPLIVFCLRFALKKIIKVKVKNNRYSQTCVQRPPLGPEKKWSLFRGGRYSEGKIKFFLIIIFSLKQRVGCFIDASLLYRDLFKRFHHRYGCKNLNFSSKIGQNGRCRQVFMKFGPKFWRSLVVVDRWSLFRGSFST